MEPGSGVCASEVPRSWRSPRRAPADWMRRSWPEECGRGAWPEVLGSGIVWGAGVVDMTTSPSIVTAGDEVGGASKGGRGASCAGAVPGSGGGVSAAMGVGAPPAPVGLKLSGKIDEAS